MKKLILVIVIVISISSFATPTHLSDSKLAPNTNFMDAYKSASFVNWKSASNFKKVTVLVDQQQVNIFYNEFGELIGSTSQQDFDKLPARAVSTITSKYTFPEYTLTDCIKFTNAEDEVKYYISMNTQDYQLVLEISEYGNTRIYSKTKK